MVAKYLCRVNPHVVLDETKAQGYESRGNKHKEILNFLR